MLESYLLGIVSDISADSSSRRTKSFPGSAVKSNKRSSESGRAHGYGLQYRQPFLLDRKPHCGGPNTDESWRIPVCSAIRRNQHARRVSDISTLTAVKDRAHIRNQGLIAQRRTENTAGTCCYGLCSAPPVSVGLECLSALLSCQHFDKAKLVCMKA